MLLAVHACLVFIQHTAAVVLVQIRHTDYLLVHAVRNGWAFKLCRSNQARGVFVQLRRIIVIGTNWAFKLRRSNQARGIFVLLLNITQTKPTPHKLFYFGYHSSVSGCAARVKDTQYPARLVPNRRVDACRGECSAICVLPPVNKNTDSRFAL